MTSIHTEIVIAAPQDRVWALLTDLDGYAAWNPFITFAQGRIALGERLLCRPLLPGERRPHEFRPVVNMVRPGEAFSWLGHVLAPFVASGEHIFALKRADGGVRLVHDERFGGLLAPLMRGRLVAKTVRGFELMNEALKRRAETA